MIVNHKYKFIFLKTRKTAGTSIEIALSEFCDSSDIITPIADKDEALREEAGYQGPCNYDVPLKKLSKTELLQFFWNRYRKQFYNHVDAAYVRKYVGEKTWGSYFKFSFERNPFDKAVSRYYWSTEEPRPSASEYLDSAPVELLTDWPIYTINDQLAVDFLGRYENLKADMKFVAERLGLPGEINLLYAKGGYRPKRSHYRDVLDEQARARIEVVCAKEIAALKFQWEDGDIVL